MSRHTTVPPEAPCVKRTRRPGSWRGCPEQLRVEGRPHVRFVPLIIHLRASAPGTESVRRPGKATIPKALNKHRLFQQ